MKNIATKPKSKYLSEFLLFLLVTVLIVVGITLHKKLNRQSEPPQENTSQLMVTPAQPAPTVKPAEKSSAPIAHKGRTPSPEVQKDKNLASKEKQTPQLEEQPEKAVEKLNADTLLNLLSNQTKYDKSLEKGPEENLRILTDKNSSHAQRRRAAWSLATFGDEKAMSGLEELLSGREIPNSLKAVILEGLGYSESPLAKQMIMASLEKDDDVTIRGALKGLAVIGDEDSVEMLSNFMLSDHSSDRITHEAAMGLGKIQGHNTYGILIDAYNSAKKSEDEGLRENIIFALGQQDIKKTSGFLQTILDDKTTDGSLQAVAVEAVEDAQGDTIPFLLKNLNHKNSEVRESVAWALVVNDAPGNIAEVIQNALTSEKMPEVRKRLYQVLEGQEIKDFSSITQIVFQETDLGTKLAGYGFLADNIASSKNTELIQTFENVVVPDLMETALKADKLNIRLNAVISLKRANTPASASALQYISQQSSDNGVLKAIN